MIIALDNIQIPASKLRKVIKDPEKTAKAVELVYVDTQQEGYTRVKSGKGFRYMYRNKVLKDKAALDRIRSLVIPPAWKDVWICTLENGHLQATGIDAMNRKQYRYHPRWTEVRNHTKFYRMLSFGNKLPSIRERTRHDLALQGLPKEKVLALVVMLMEKTSIRVGNNNYEKMYGSFGITTLKDRHVRVAGKEVKFIFKGKKGVQHSINLKNKKLAQLVQQCKDIPGKELFQYYDAEGKHQSIDSGMVNAYLKEISGEDFTAKDFRTWSGTVQALIAFHAIGGFENKTGAKKNIVAALDMVSAHLGNTRTVCKKYYVHPALLEMYEDNRLQKWIDQMTSCLDKDCMEDAAEKTLMELLSKL